MKHMKTVQFREALREAMQEEMRRDKGVFLIGEEVAEYNGAYKVSQGMLDEFGAKRTWFYGYCGWRFNERITTNC
jgi:pyruvate dehydrogenase E1 component beta subunit